VDDLGHTPAMKKVPNFVFKKDLIPNSEVKKRLLADGIHPDTIKQLQAEHDVNKAAGGPGLFDGIAEMWALTEQKGKTIIRIMRLGKAEYWDIEDNMLLDSMINIDKRSIELLKIPRAFKTVLTAGVTREPGFWYRNSTRDALQAYMVTPGMVPILDSGKGLVKAMLKTGGMLDMMFAGASFQGGYVNGTNPEAALKSLRVAMRRKGFSPKHIEKYTGKIVDFGALGWDKWTGISDSFENASREAVVEVGRRKGKSRMQYLYESKDLMDFSMQGQWLIVRAMGDLHPFFNPRLVGAYKLYRSGAIPLPSLVAMHVLRKGLALMAFSMILAWMHRDNDEYNAMEDWEKDLFWHFFPGTIYHFVVPKPFELGIVFGTIPERMTRLMTGDDNFRKFMERLEFAWKQTMSFEWEPQYRKPLAEIEANKSFFTERPIHTAADLQKLPRGRYNSATSETMVEIAPWLEKNTEWLKEEGLSPKEAEHLIRGYLATLGNYGLMATDIATRQIIGSPPVPSSKASDLPGIGAVYKGIGPAWNTRYATEMYEMSQEITLLYNTVRSYEKENKPEEIEQLLSEGNNREILDFNWKGESRNKKNMDKWRKEMSAFRKAIDEIHRHPTMSGDEKEEAIDNLIRARNKQTEAYFNYWSPLFGRK
jgi:hypothetical protein